MWSSFLSLCIALVVILNESLAGHSVLCFAILRVRHPPVDSVSHGMGATLWLGLFACMYLPSSIERRTYAIGPARIM